MIIRSIKVPTTVPATPTEDNFSCWRPAACVLFALVLSSLPSESDTHGGSFSPFINSIEVSPMYSEIRSHVLTTILQRMTAGMVSRSAIDCGSSKGMSTAATTVNNPGLSASEDRLTTRTSSGRKATLAITSLLRNVVLSSGLKDKE